MKFIYGKTDWSSMERRQENCYLLTNGLGGFSSLTMVGSSARNDHALLMASIKAPNSRYNMILNLGEILYVDNKEYELSTHDFIDSEKNRRGYESQSMFSFEDLPHWIYNAGGVQIDRKSVV